LASGVGQLALREENGLLETFLSMCGSSTPAPSCQDERLQQTSCAEWRARGSCTTARLQSNPSIALTPAPANSFRWCEAAAAVAGGGARRCWRRGGDPPPPPCVRRRAGRDAWRGLLVHRFGRCASGALYATLPVGDATNMGYSQSKATQSTLDLFASTFSCAPHAYFAAPVSWGRKAV
jgi:hypothetical protein